MRYLITLEQTEAGFSVQVPDLAIVTFEKTIQQAKHAAIKAIKINLEAYQEAGKTVPGRKPVEEHLENPDFADLLFTHVDVEVYAPKEAVLV